MLTTYLIHRSSAESPDGDDEIKAMLQELPTRTKSGETQPQDVRPA